MENNTSLSQISGKEFSIESAEAITDVKHEAWRLASKVYGQWSIFILALAVVVILLNPLLSAPVIILWWAYIYNKAQKSFMRQFAILTGMDYMDSMEVSEVTGRLFQIGHSENIFNVISGTFETHPVRLFNYNYSQGSGKHKRTYSFTVYELFFPKTIFPHILLRSKTMAKYSWTDNVGNPDTEIKLEGDFNDTFKLYAKANYEIEVLEIFTPTLLSFFCEHAKHFSIEFSDNRIYIYDDKIIGSKKDLLALHNVAQFMIKSVGPLLNRMHDDFAALHEYYERQ